MPKFSDIDNAFVPETNEQLYIHYILGRGGESLTKSLVRHFIPYLTEDEQEALTHDVFVRCMEKEVIKKYDPTKANFGGVIFFVTRTICLNFKDRRTRNPMTGLSAGTIDTTKLDMEFEPGILRLDSIFSKEPDVSEVGIDTQRFLNSMFEWARSLSETGQNKRDKSLFLLLGLMAQQLEPKECAPLLGVTTSTIHNWMGFIKSHALSLRSGVGIDSHGKPSNA